MGGALIQSIQDFVDFFCDCCGHNWLFAFVYLYLEFLYFCKAALGECPLLNGLYK